MFQLYNSPRDRLKQQLFRKKTFYTPFWALKGISFDVKKGESLGILGHNGAGKSTLLQILAGTMAPTAGEAVIRGRIGTILSMGSGFRLDFTGRENVYILGALMGFEKRQIHESLETIKEFADIGFFFDRPIRTYSSGMSARLSFAVYTCLKPDLLLVDEVINVGDAEFKEKCLAHISHLLDYGMSLVLVTHSPNIVRQFCHSGIVLERGRMVFSGNVEEALKIYQKVRSRFNQTLTSSK
jgi:lipopolysaccharide transport system ATP-binding protein